MKLTIEISKSTFDRIERMRKYQGSKTAQMFIRAALEFFIHDVENTKATSGNSYSKFNTLDGSKLPHTSP